MNFSLRYDSSVLRASKAEVGDLVRGALFQTNTQEQGIICFGVAVRACVPKPVPVVSGEWRRFPPREHGLLLLAPRAQPPTPLGQVWGHKLRRPELAQAARLEAQGSPQREDPEPERRPQYRKASPFWRRGVT